ncbi:TPA: phage repressor protein CI, partial [Enterobacter bugandensis]|nr:phage repressor protein CI [Enterobacter bugandensis]
MKTTQPDLFTNVNSHKLTPHSSISQTLSSLGVIMNLEKGGRVALERMVDAYGYTTRQALCDHLGVSKSTLATRYMRDSFPSEWVIQCALETAVSLNWLVTGTGLKYEKDTSDLISIKKCKIIDGAVNQSSYLMFDKAFLPTELTSPIFIQDHEKSYIADETFLDISDGKFLIQVDNKFSIREIAQIPNNRVKVINDS